MSNSPKSSSQKKKKYEQNNDEYKFIKSKWFTKIKVENKYKKSYKI